MLTSTRLPTATILAGGLSRRMFESDARRGDKGLLDLGGRSMIEHVIARVRPQTSALVLNANGDPARFAELGLPIAADPVDGFVGPLAGVLAGMRWTADRHPEVTHTVTVSSDAPFIPLDLVHRLMNALVDSPHAIAIAASAGNVHPVIGLWPVAHADDLDAALRAGVRKVLAWTDRHGTIPVDFPMVRAGGRDVDPFFNANTPQELADARDLLDRLGP